ncbi:hypothetical protein S100390_v1c05140 [Spiroplasma sp. NBRC 100390]|uniref:hypothetical protein n=1 Tax=unclassified Spiroplasma TaxID=2637901 RepID=UPI00089283B5|nr:MULTISPECIES: hypothetical protein [unclassified Spiroplasma]AOX43853.1 hypothetical protein STU14_v1c05140 [Spiroplasma sp. TU-14]APE13323.1 hypothetical protein S100390_v1c05140 [Spiroplasma sp. NBRC 100390]
MKKILSLVSVLIISGTSMPTFITVSKYEKQNNGTNTKNYTINGNDERIETDKDDNFSYFELLLKPETFENLAHIYYSNKNDKRLFSNTFLEFAKKNITGIYGNSPDYALGEAIWDHWNEIIEVYKNSSKDKRIKINYRLYTSVISMNIDHFNASIVPNDTILYSNSYVKKLNDDFKSDLIKWEKVGLGIIEDNNNNYIFDRIKVQYPNLNINDVEIIKKEELLSLSEGFLLKLKIKDNSKIYSIGNIKNDFIFNTKVNLKKINDILVNDPKVQLWLYNLKDWKKRIKREIIEDVPKLSEAQKNIWKDNVAEQMKSYIRDWDYILNLIEIDLKIEKLNNSINNLKKDIDNLKREINRINEKIDSILSPSDKYCSTTTKVASQITKYIPHFGDVLSEVFGIMSVLCQV